VLKLAVAINCEGPSLIVASSSFVLCFGAGERYERYERYNRRVSAWNPIAYETSNNLLLFFFRVAQTHNLSHYGTTHSRPTAIATQLWVQVQSTTANQLALFAIWRQITIIDHFAMTVATMNGNDNLSASSNMNASLGDRAVIEAPGALALSAI
jgi:hypothetical protein